MYCLGCGYDLQALDQNRCPECGQTFNLADPASYRRTPCKRHISVFLAPLMAACAIIAAFFAGWWTGDAIFGLQGRGPAFDTLILIGSLIAAASLLLRWLIRLRLLQILLAMVYVEAVILAAVCKVSGLSPLHSLVWSHVFSINAPIVPGVLVGTLLGSILPPLKHRSGHCRGETNPREHEPCSPA